MEHIRTPKVTCSCLLWWERFGYSLQAAMSQTAAVKPDVEGFRNCISGVIDGQNRGWRPNPIPNPRPNPKCYRNRVRSSPTVLHVNHFFLFSYTTCVTVCLKDDGTTWQATGQ